MGRVNTEGAEGKITKGPKKTDHSITAIIITSSIKAAVPGPTTTLYTAPTPTPHHRGLYPP